MKLGSTKPLSVCMNARRSAALGLRTSVLLCVCTIVPLACRVEVGEEKPVYAVVIHEEYFQWVDLSEKQDETHTIPLLGPKGKIWHRAVEPVLDLSDLEFTKSRPDADQNGDPAIATGTNNTPAPS